MAQLGIALLCVFPIICHVTADPGTSMDISYGDQSSKQRIHVDFSSNLFYVFHSCLCDKTHNQCNMQLERTHKRTEWIGHYRNFYYNATKGSLNAQQNLHQPTYTSIYTCAFQFARKPIPASIQCSRVVQNDVKDRSNNDWKKSFFLESVANRCSLPCVTVRWSRQQTLNTVTSTAEGFHDGSCQDDPPVTSTSAPSKPTRKTPVTPQKLSLPPKTTATSKTMKPTKKIQPNKIKPKAPETTTQKIRRVSSKDKSPSEDNTIFLAVVYTIVGILIIIIIVLCVLMGRRRKQQQQQQQQQQKQQQQQIRSTPTSRHDVTEPGTVSQNCEVENENLDDNSPK